MGVVEDREGGSHPSSWQGMAVLFYITMICVTLNFLFKESAASAVTFYFMLKKPAVMCTNK